MFHHADFGEIRTVMIDGEPWFVGKDMAHVLGYRDTYNAMKLHVDTEEMQNWQNASFESPRGLTVINESGVYCLMERGYFEVRKTVFVINGEPHTSYQTLVTGKGQLFIIKKLREAQLGGFL